MTSPPVHDSAAAILNPARAQQFSNDLLHRLAVRTEEIATERRAHVCHGSVERTMPVIGIRGDRRQMELNLAKRRENRGRDPRRRGEPFGVQRLHLLFDGRFALPGDAQKAPEEPRGSDISEQPFLDDGVEHRLELPRRTWQEHNQLPLMLDPEPGRRSVLVRQHRRALGHHRLPPVDFRRSQIRGRRIAAESPRKCGA